jgi:dipeptidase D
MKSREMTFPVYQGRNFEMRKIVILLLCVLATLYLGACVAGDDVLPDPPDADTDASDTDDATDVITDDSESTEIDGSFADRAFGHFLGLLNIPRCSGNEQEISDYLVAFAKSHGLEVLQDESMNVLIRKPGSSGRENEPPVILQAHMDMVCEKNADSDHDFTTDAIIPVIDGDWISADGTTLGADNGAGLAMIMAVLESTDLSHPPIEAIITTNEEAGMTGAINFDFSLITGDRFINIDYMDETVFTVSSAGTYELKFLIPIEYEATAQNAEAYMLTISGLAGGHSGIDIDKVHANAIILMGFLLSELVEITDVHISNIEGGSSRNAIPRECRVVILVSENNEYLMKSLIEEKEEYFRSEYPDENDISITLEPVQAPQHVMSRESMQKMIDGILLIPNGVFAMSEHIQGLVQTSNNPGVIKRDGSNIVLTNYARSSDNDDQESLISIMEEVAIAIGAEIIITKGSPPWVFREDSPLREIMTGVYIEIFDREPIISAVHAGLECAIFADKMPSGDFISIGPDIENLHSPDERMSISSFNRVSEFLVRVLEEL